MTRVAIIAGIYQPELCGVAHYTSRLRAALQGQGVDCVVLTTRAAAREVNESGVRGVVDDWGFADLRSLIAAVHAAKADVLHIQYAAETYGFQRSLLWLPLMLKLAVYWRPIVTTVHEYGGSEGQSKRFRSRSLKWLQRWGERRGWWDREDGFLLSLSSAVITPDAQTESLIYQRLPHINRRVFNIPLAANVDVVPMDRAVTRSQLRERYRWDADSLVIAFFGFLHPAKGLETLLLAFSQVLATYPQARLLLVGGVESMALSKAEANLYWDELQGMVSKLGLHEMVHLTGYADAQTVSVSLSGADVGVLPFHDGLTMKSSSLLTMLAHSLPVVATQHPTMTLPYGHPVQLIPSQDVNALANALSQLLANPTLRQQLANASRKFGTKFDWDKIARSHFQIYQQALRW